MFGNSTMKIPFSNFIHSPHYWIWNVFCYVLWRLLTKMYIHLHDVKSLILKLTSICISNFCTNHNSDNFMFQNSLLLLSKLTPLIIPHFITEWKWAENTVLKVSSVSDEKRWPWGWNKTSKCITQGQAQGHYLLTSTWFLKYWAVLESPSIS